MISSMVLAASVLAAPLAAQVGDDLEPGTRFLSRIQYSNFWEINSISGVTRRGRPIDDPLSRLQLQSMDQDPLFVDLELEGKVVSAGLFTVTPRVTSARYFDARGREWTIETRRKGARERARTLLEALLISWRREFLAAVDREMVEEQILGAALVLLDGEEIEIVFEDAAGDARLPGLSSLLTTRLPESLPLVLHEHIHWFFREAIAKTFAPVTSTPRKGTEVEVRGIAYRVEEVQTIRKRRVARLAGQVHHPEVGVYAKDRFTFDVASGLVTEGTSLTMRDAVNGNTHRVGSVRWQVNLKALRSAPGDGPTTGR